MPKKVYYSKPKQGRHGDVKATAARNAKRALKAKTKAQGGRELRFTALRAEIHLNEKKIPKIDCIKLLPIKLPITKVTATSLPCVA